MTEPVSTMSSRRDKDKGSGNTGKNAKQDKSSSRDAREDRMSSRRLTSSGDGLDGAVTAAAAVRKERQTRHSTSLSPPTSKSSSKARSATNSPVLQQAETHKRIRQAEPSESSHQ